MAKKVIEKLTMSEARARANANAAREEAFAAQERVQTLEKQLAEVQKQLAAVPRNADGTFAVAAPQDRVAQLRAAAAQGDVDAGNQLVRMEYEATRDAIAKSPWDHRARLQAALIAVRGRRALLDTMPPVPAAAPNAEKK